jgi:hypothetical protein
MLSSSRQPLSTKTHRAFHAEGVALFVGGKTAICIRHGRFAAISTLLLSFDDLDVLLYC